MKLATFKIRLPQQLALLFILSLATGFRASAQNWLLNGNVGTNPDLNFIGTTDARDLRFRTNNLARVSITSSGNVGVGITAPLYRFHVATNVNTRAGFFDNTFNSAAETYGLYANVDNPGTGNSTGGFFSATGAGGTLNRGIRATASGNATNYGVSAFAQSVAGQTAVGLVAQASGAGTNLAALFHGNTHINNGNLGIGVSAPAFPLQFAPNVGNKICLYQSGANQYGLGIADLRMQLYVPTSNSSFVFGTGHSAAFTEQMRIQGNGRVGIGTASPNSRLHVKGNLTLENSDNTNTFSIRTESNGDIQFVGFFNGASNTRMIIRDEDGRVGIGTGTPNARLHVNGDLRLQSPNNNTYLMRVEDSGGLNFVGDDGSGLFITNDGDRVGIGTINPPANYRLAVNGRVICEEVRVQLTEDWPDYVFRPEYRLTPLDELEKSIAANGHLPGIPSAAEVKDQGVAVGEMQARLLEKVEELTLYLIQLKKENEALRQAVESLKQ